MEIDQKQDYLYSVLVPPKTPLGIIKRFICYILLTIMIMAASSGLYYAAYHYTATNPDRKTVDAPFYDTNNYRAITLPNRLQALLVSNPNTEIASVALQIGVGSFSDPEDIEGVAHLCMHLALLGSKNYPDGQFLDYLTNYTGFQESIIDLEKTTLSFQLVSGALEKALLMFSDMFIEPVFVQADMEEALAAISAEMEKNYGSTPWRVHSLLQLLSSMDHPFSRFMSGNNETLSTASESEATSLYNAVKKFFKDYYSSNIMTLVISSNQDLNTLENWTKTSFTMIPDKSVTVPSFNSFGNPFEGSKETYTEFLPVGQENEIYLLFYTMPLDKYYPEKPFEYLQHLLEYKGEGSLSEYLADLSYAQDIKVSVETNATFGSIVQVKATLAEEAVAYPDLFLIAFFSYIDLVKSQGINRQIWDNLAQEATLNFNFTRTLYSKPIRYAQKLVSNLAKYKYKEAITGDLLFKNYDTVLLEHFLSSFSIKNCVVLISSPLYKNASNSTNETQPSSDFVEVDSETVLDDKEERTSVFKTKGANKKLFKTALSSGLIHRRKRREVVNHTLYIPTNASDEFSEASYIFLKYKPVDTYDDLFKVRYTTHKIPSSFSSMVNNLTYKSIPQFALPAENPYFPSVTPPMICDLLSPEACSAEFERDAQVYWPADVSSYLDYGKAWYQMDRSFRTPKAIVDLMFHSPIVYRTPQLQFQFLLYCSYLKSILQPKLSLQSHAGYTFDVRCEIDTLEFIFSGYTDKLQNFTKNVTSMIATTTFSPEKYAFELKKLLASLNQTKSQVLYKQATSRICTLLLNYSYSADELMKAGSQLTYSDWKNITDTLRYLKYDSIIVGNIAKDSARDLSDKLLASFGIVRVDDDEILHHNIADIAGKSIVFREFSPLEDSTDNLVMNVYLDGPVTPSIAARLAILESLIRAPAKQELLFKKKIGSDVGVKVIPIANYSGLSIMIQGSANDPLSMDEQIEGFLSTFESYLSSLPDAEFEAERDEVVSVKNMDYNSLEEKAQSYADRVRDLSYNFNFTTQMAEIASGLSKAEILDYFKDLVGSNIQKLSFQYYYKQTPNSTLPTTVLASSETYAGVDETLFTSDDDFWK